MVWQHEVRSCYLFIKLFVVLSPEGETTTKESKHQNSRSVNISRWAAKLKLLNYFRRHIRRRTTEELDFLSVGNLSAEPEVNKFDVTVLVEHNIFKLDISMCYTFRV